MKQEVNDCISNLENHVHTAFAAQRVAGQDFVFRPTPEVFSALDAYCDEATFQEIRPPLLLSGPSGTGKTAILANWLRKREQNSIRSPTEEYLFWHAVGCSRQSLDSNSLIRRLIAGLQSHFELSRSLPRNNDRLSWELPRFLELAAKKGRLIVVVDGVQRLRGHDGSEDSLSWLPLDLPPNVRVILSVAESSPAVDSAEGNVQDEYHHQSKKSKILLELSRRKLATIHLPTLDPGSSRALVMEFLETSIRTETTAMSVGPYGTLPIISSDNNTVSASSKPTTRAVSGLLLFECHIQELINHRLGGNPQFLRLFLKSLHYAVGMGFSLWSTFDDWLQAQTLEELYSRIILSCEKGFEKSREHTQTAMDLAMHEGGFLALHKLYPSHPGLHSAKRQNTANATVNHSQSSANSSPQQRRTQSVSHGNVNAFDMRDVTSSLDVEGTLDQDTQKLSNAVSDSLGNQESVTLERQAQAQLQRAVFRASQTVDDISSGGGGARTDDPLLWQSLLSRLLSDDHVPPRSVQSISRNRNLSADTSICSGTLPLENSQDEGTIADSSEDDDEEYSTIDAKKRQSVIRSPSRGTKAPFSSAPDSPKNSQLQIQAQSDPSASFFLLPTYLRGGSNAVGLNELLGDALALLFVSRQGLKEDELWKMLSFLQHKRIRDTPVERLKREKEKEKQKSVRLFGEAILRERAQLEHLCKSEDSVRNGYIDETTLYSVVRRTVSDIEKDDFHSIVEFVENSFQKEKFSGIKDVESVMVKDKLTGQEKITYEIFFHVLTKLFKKLRTNGHKQQSKSNSQSKRSKEPEEVADQFDDFRLGTQSPTDNDLQPSDSSIPLSLGSITESLLLQCLCALGVLYSAENKVFILPAEAAVLRKTVHNRYLSNAVDGHLPNMEGDGMSGEQHWHSLIIAYFRSQPTTLRKCEELPWHLKICKKWAALKDTLVDLKTFDLMFNNDLLKDELVEYWALLSDGPLFIADSPPGMTSTIGSNCSGGSWPNNNPSSTLIAKEDDRPSLLQEIDLAIQNHTTLREVRKRLHKNLLQPFDIVDELNRSLEAWVTEQRPTPVVLQRTIFQISTFLLEFSRASIQFPQLRRLGIDMSLFSQFHVDLSQLKSAMQFQSGGQRDEEREKEEEEKREKEEEVYFDESAKHEALKFPTQTMIMSNFYLYLRWVWIQFPWLALSLATNVDRNSITDDIGDGADEGPKQKSESEVYAQQLLRIWNVKKTDPTVPVFSSSMSRRQAEINSKSTMSSSLQRNVDVSCRKLVDELQQPSHIAQVRLGLSAHKDKFRRSFEQEVEMSKRIPFAYHGSKVMKSGSLFPSYDAMLKESNQKKIDSDIFMSEDLHSEASSRGGSILRGQQAKSGKDKKIAKFDVDVALKNREATFLLTELDDEIHRLTGEEYLQAHRSDNSLSLIRDETDLELGAVQERIAKMKNICNKLLIIQKEKQKTILELEKSILLRQESDTMLINEVQSGETLIQSLNERNVVMEESLVEAVALREGYLSLISALRLNPPYVESHIRSLEMEVSLAEKQFDELCSHRSKLFFENERVDRLKKEKLEDRIGYFKTARSEIQVKKKQVQREIKRLRDSIMGRHRDLGKRGSVGDRDHLSLSQSASDIDSDVDDEKSKNMADLSVTAPVAQFLNAIVRKFTYNEAIIKEGDNTLDDVKKRAPLLPDREQDMGAIEKKKKPKDRPKDVTVAQQASSPQRSPKHVNPISSHGTSNATAYGGPKRRMSVDINNIRNSVRPDNNSAALEVARQTVDHLFARTESSSLEEFLDRYSQNQSLLETLRSQQVLVDARLAQLRAEHIELFTSWGDSSFVNDDRRSKSSNSLMATSDEVAMDSTAASSPAQSGSADVVDTADRYLDNQLFAKEVRLHHFQRLFDSAVHTVSEVRTAVQHIMNLLMVNTKLLSGLPRSSPPSLNSDTDIPSALSWCEDRVIALNEALTMDANRTNTTTNEESKPLALRQTELAAMIYNMNSDKKKRNSENFKSSRKNKGALSNSLINSADQVVFVSSPRLVKIPPAAKIDKIFDSKMSKLVTERDNHSELYESKYSYSRDPNFSSNEIQRFLTDGLDKVYTKNVSRQAKMLMNNRPGRTATYGMVLEELMNSRGQTMNFLSGLADSSPKKDHGSPKKKSSTQSASKIVESQSPPPDSSAPNITSTHS